MRYLGEERVLKPEDVWAKGAKTIEHLGLASYSTRVEYPGITDVVCLSYQPMEHQYQDRFPVIAMTNSVHVDPVSFLNVFDLTGQTVIAILCILAFANGYCMISKQEDSSGRRKKLQSIERAVLVALFGHDFVITFCYSQFVYECQGHSNGDK